jgi:hypothetical protein
MHKTKPSIDARFYKEEEIDKELKCPSCFLKFDSPRILPCGDSICFQCIELIKDHSQNEEFKCPVCEEVQNIDVNNLPRNKILEKLLTKEANEIYRNECVEELKISLDKLMYKTEKLENYLNYPHDKITKHSKSLLDQIDLATEQFHQIINDSRDALFNQVKEYEKDCLGNIDSLKKPDGTVLENNLKPVELIIDEAKKIFHEKVEYLRNFKIDANQIFHSTIASERFIKKN